MAETTRDFEEIPTPLATFARRHRLHIRRDECGTPVIPGHRGNSQLYFDGLKLCLLVCDGPIAYQSRWKASGGELWIGDISPDAQGRRLQDVKITGIPSANAEAAIRMAQIKPKRIMSEAQRLQAAQALAKARNASPDRKYAPARATPGCTAGHDCEAVPPPSDPSAHSK